MLQEVVDQRLAEREDDFISLFLDSEVDGHRLTPDDVIDIGYLFFLAGLDTVTASLDCMLAYLAQHPEQRQELVDDPGLIPHAVEELLRWEAPVQGVVRITTQDTVLNGCPIAANETVSVMLGSANIDERTWERPRRGGLPPRRSTSTSPSAAARTAASAPTWPAWSCGWPWRSGTWRSPTTACPRASQLRYSQGLRSVDNLELVW